MLLVVLFGNGEYGDKVGKGSKGGKGGKGEL